MSIVAKGTAALRDLDGSHLGWTDWRRIAQRQVDLFAEATGDHQWIHVDPSRAANGPFGGTIAHGYLTLSLGPVLLSELLVVEGMTFGVNYGANKVRFPSPVKVGSNLRMGAEVTMVEDVPGGVQVSYTLTFETEGSPKPACVAEVVYRYFD